MKPSHDARHDGRLADALAHLHHRREHVGAVALPRTTSSSFMTLAGLKKCAPSTSPGLCVTLAMRSIVERGRVVARIAPWRAISSSLAGRGPA
jgi:hypothetical protein